MNIKKVQEIAEFLIMNKGPDLEGKGHGTKKRLTLEEAEEGIKLAESYGLGPGFRPYHIKSTLKVWQEQEYLNEVLVKKVDSLVKSKYGSLVELIRKTDRDELYGPLFDQVNGRAMRVSMGGVGEAVDNCPFAGIWWYINLKNMEKDFFGLRPYHMRCTGRNVYDEAHMIDEIVTKKTDWILENKYHGDLKELVFSLKQEEVHQEHIDLINGEEMPVSTHHVARRLRDLYGWLERYFRAKHLPFDYPRECFKPHELAMRRKRLEKFCKLSALE